DSTKKRCSVTSFYHAHQARSLLDGNLTRSVRGPVVRDQHLSIDVELPQVPLRFPDARSQRLCLIEARHEYSEFERRCFLLALPIGGAILWHTRRGDIRSLF